MDIRFVLRKEMKKGYSPPMSSIIRNMKKEFVENKTTFLKNLLKFNLPKYDVLGVFIPPDVVLIDVETMYHHYPEQKRFTPKLKKSIIHESLHYTFCDIREIDLTDAQEHWAIKKLEY